jgi:hypothetical protein
MGSTNEDTFSDKLSEYEASIEGICFRSDSHQHMRVNLILSQR